MERRAAWHPRRQPSSPQGNNITDANILTADGTQCPYLNTDNHNGRVGVVDASDVLLADSDGSPDAQTVLDSIAERASYMGFTDVDANVQQRQKVVVRFQSSFVPEHASITPRHFSYQTRRAENPRNLLVLGCPQGVFVQADRPGSNCLFAHSLEGATVHQHRFDVECNRDCRVGEAATPADDDPSHAKKARAVEMGIRGMGARTNCFVILSIPNEQAAAWESDDDAVFVDYEPPIYRSLGANTQEVSETYSARVSIAEARAGTATPMPIAISRKPTEPIVLTILTYNAVAPSPDGSLRVATSDVELAVQDLERQYELVERCGGVVCKLSELPSMLHKMTAEDMKVIRRAVREAAEATESTA